MSNYSAWNIEPLDHLPTDSSEALMHLVRWAVLAPSAHNAQPWKFEVQSQEELLVIEHDWSRPVSVTGTRQAWISIGCALRNLIVAAEYYGYGYQAFTFIGKCAVGFKLIPDGDKKLHANRDELLAIKSRRMNRGKYDLTRAVSASIIEEAQTALKKHNEIVPDKLTLDFISDPLTKSAIAEIQYLADRYVVAKNEFRKELSRYMLPNDSQQPRGMPGSTFGLSDEMALHLCDELKKDGPFDVNLAVGFAAATRDGIKSAPLIGVISVDRVFWASILMAGAFFQKLALIAEKNRLGISVHAALVEAEVFNKLLRLRLGRSERPTVIFRMGYPLENRPHSPRLPAEFVTLTKNLQFEC